VILGDAFVGGDGAVAKPSVKIFRTLITIGAAPDAMFVAFFALLRASGTLMRTSIAMFGPTDAQFVLID